MKLKNIKPTCFCYLGLIFLTIISCDCKLEKQKTEDCQPKIFEAYQEVADSCVRETFKLDSTVFLDDGSCGYWHEFNSWLNIPFEWKGSLHFSNKENKVLFMPIFDSIQHTFFNFSLPLDSSENISYDVKYRLAGISQDTLIFPNKKDYFLNLEDVFFDEKLKDTIYRFRFKDFYPIELSEDLVFLVGKRVRIRGIYIYNPRWEEGSPHIVRFWLGNVYPLRMDTVNLQYGGNFL